MPSDSTIRETYDAVADLYADHFRSTEPEQALELAMIDDFVAQLAPPRRVLDAGSGAGRMMAYLAERGCDVEGIDLSPEMVRRSRQDHPGFPAREGDLARLPYPDSIFDGVMAWYSTIHTPDEELDAVLAELSRVLSPGGLLLVAFQSGSGVREVGAGYRARGKDVELLRWHRSASDLAARLGRLGLAEVARLERAARGAEADAQAVIVARRA